MLTLERRADSQKEGDVTQRYCSLYRPDANELLSNDNTRMSIFFSFVQC